MEPETRAATSDGRRPTRWPYIYSWEPTVFWGLVILFGLVGIALPLWGIWYENREQTREAVRTRMTEELKGGVPSLRETAAPSSR